MSNYNKGDKFIVEISEVMETKEGKLYRAKGMSDLVFDDYRLGKLSQLVQGVDKFSYAKGYKDGLAEAKNEIRPGDEVVNKDDPEDKFIVTETDVDWNRNLILSGIDENGRIIADENAEFYKKTGRHFNISLKEAR